MLLTRPLLSLVLLSGAVVGPLALPTAPRLEAATPARQSTVNKIERQVHFLVRRTKHHHHRHHRHHGWHSWHHYRHVHHYGR